MTCLKWFYSEILGVFMETGISHNLGSNPFLQRCKGHLFFKLEVHISKYTPSKINRENGPNERKNMVEG